MALAVSPSQQNNVMVQSSPNFVLLSCDKINTGLIIDRIKQIPLVIDVKEIEGAYDILVILQPAHIDKVKQTIVDKIRPIPGIRTSLTLFGNNSSLT